MDKTDPTTMKPGQRSRSRLHLHEESALVVSCPTLFDQDGKWVADRREPGGDFSAVPVKLGPSTAGLVTVVSGLKEGETVACAIRQGGGRTGAHRGRRRARPEQTMKASDAVRFALENLSSRRRHGVVDLGMMFGVAVVIAMLSIGAGANGGPWP